MNPLLVVLLFLCSALAIASSHADDELIFFYRVGTVIYEVDQFEDGLPVLDTRVQEIEGHIIGNREWSYAGELPVDLEFMSNVYPYVVQKLPRLYWDRDKPSSHVAKPLASSDTLLPWYGKNSEEGMIVYGWVSNGKVSSIACSSFGASEQYKASILLSGSGLDPNGKMVAWFVDNEGELLSFDARKNPAAILGRQEVKTRKSIDRVKNTALHLAAINGDDALAKLILEDKRSNSDSRNENGQTPLMFAAMAGREKLVERLLDRGAKRYAIDKTGRCALHYAAESGSLDAVRKLVSKAPFFPSERAIFEAVALDTYYKGDQEIAIYLASLTIEDDLKLNLGNRTPIDVLDMISNGRVQLAMWLMDKHGLDPGYVNEEGVSYMHAAAIHADVELLERLRNLGVPISITAQNGITPLLVACSVGNREAICWLIDNGAETENESSQFDPLLFAVGRQAKESVSCLIDYGYDVNREMELGVSPLMLACILAEAEIAEMLLNAGGLWNFDSPYSDDALRKLIRLDSPKLLNGLFEQGLERDYKLMGMVELEAVAGFYGSRQLLDLLESLTTPGLAAMLNAGKELNRPLTWAFQSELNYPPILQERYGDIDIEAFFGVLSSGHIGMIQLGDNVPEELRHPLEETMMNWRFRPTGTDEMVAIKMSIPLHVQLNEEDIFNLREVTIMPKALKQVDPNYPAGLKSRGISGYAVIEWVIDHNGKVLRPIAVEFSHEDFGRAAVRAILDSTWSPAQIDGRGVAVRVRQRMDFNPPKK